VLYQDAAIDLDRETADPNRDSELSAFPWHPDSAVPPAPPARPLKAASVVPLVHHVTHHHAAHVALRPARPLNPQRRGDAAKRLLDIVGALVLTLLLSPLLLVVGLVLARQRGPIIYRHARTGRHGRTFGCLKFRTMVPNAETALRELLHQDPQLRLEWQRDQKLRHDPRITPIGRFLRRTSLDELPQLWNVLRGEMSLVGPRPVVREEWARYGRRLDSYLAAKPGVTGLWQVMGRSDSCYRRRVALDSYYVRKRTFLLDVLILLRTVVVVLRGRGAC
jgi:Undecaprenyl-phosphate galactose phosphotransferase WbaP